MSAAPRIIEGTWEEVALHATELAGHRLKVIVLDEKPVLRPIPPAVQTSAEEWAAWLYDWAHNRPPINAIADDSRDAIYEDFLQ